MSKLTGAELIAQERQRQIEVERFDKYHDEDHDSQELAFAAVTYAMPFEETGSGKSKIKRIHFWPWEPRWWKPTPNDRIRELVKAGALIAAEIDRLQQLNSKG